VPPPNNYAAGDANARFSLLQAQINPGGHAGSADYAGTCLALPSTLAMPESSGGIKEKVTFERVIVWPDGHREIDGVTPKQLPKPSDASHALPKPTDPTDGTNEGAA